MKLKPSKYIYNITPPTRLMTYGDVIVFYKILVRWRNGRRLIRETYIDKT